jgi:hypothetical protein
MEFRILSYLITALWVSGCETVITLDIPVSEPKLVVNCLFSADSVWRARITESQHVLDNAPTKAITNASVQVLVHGSPVETLQHLGSGTYAGGFMPLPGESYEIRVTAPGYDEVHATDIVPQATEIMALDTAMVTSEGMLYMECRLKFTDDGSQANFYKVDITGQWWEYEYDHFGNVIDSFMYVEPLYFEANDVILGGDGLFSGLSAIFSDDLFQGKVITAPLLVSGYYFTGSPDQNMRLIISLSSVSESYYLYSTTLSRSWDASGDPFAQPVQVYNNIEGGYGIFAGFSRDTVIMDF